MSPIEFVNTCYETTNEVRSLAFYSHLLPAFVVIILGLFSYRFSSSSAKSITFLVFTIVLSLWLICDLVLWHSNNYYAIAMFWSFLDFLNILFYFLLVLFLYLDFRKYNRIPKHAFAILSIAILIPFFYSLTGLSMIYFDEPNCEMSVSEVIVNYKFLAGLFSMITITLLGIIHFFKKSNLNDSRGRIIALSISSIIFIGVFSGSELIANITGVYETTLYALFSLPIFILFLTYSIIEQQTLDLNVSSYTFAKLLFTIFILVAIFSLFLADDFYELGTIGTSAFVTAGFGLLLLRSARKESLQREEIEKLAYGLERANERLQILDKQKSEFVSIASHQLRSPLTAIRGYVSMMAEGSFGKLPDKAQEILERVNESSKFMATSINDFLDVSRIESGNMKYEYTDVNLFTQAEHIVDDLRTDAVKRGLILLYRSDMQGTGLVRADAGKTQQILHNLINNALKYTPKGSVTVYAHDDTAKRKMYIDIIDTGIGLSQESTVKLFGKFARAKIASSANIMGTGLGLFVAREMARAMGGDITVQSEGEGRGSTFTIVFPLL